MEAKITRLLHRLSEVEELLGNPETLVDQKLYRELTQEYSFLSQLKTTWDYYQKILLQLAQNRDLLLSEKDPELIEVLKEEIRDLEREETISKQKLETLVVPPDPKDSCNTILELRAGTGGEEAALFVADCIRMYQNYASRKGWRYEVLSSTPSDMGGFKEYIMALSGPNVYRYLQYEAGTHRVQRVPATEAQGRLHTSAITVAVLLEPTDDASVEISDKDLMIDTYRASGAGGQHVNVTDSAVRITHLPTGVVVTCQDERSQHKNKEKAMRLLRAKILEERQRKQQSEIAALRSSQVGSGDRSERIRTYNFPQNRLTDHRIDLTLYKLDQIIDGDLDDVTQALVSFYYQQKLLSE
jgi:peptide chain release factor 1